MSFYRVLVPLDGSDLAESALIQAESLANKLGRIRLVTAIDDPPPKIAGYPFYPLLGMGLAYLKMSVDEQASHQLDYLKLMTSKLRAKGIDADYVIGYGPAPAVILEAAADFNADVIVMASHGLSGLRRSIIGSVAGEVSNRSKHPVMVIPAQKQTVPAAV